MDLIGALLLILALGVVTAVFVARPFMARAKTAGPDARAAELEEHRREHAHSALLAERDRMLNALQELDFDFALGKVPEEEYPAMRGEMLAKGAGILRALDEFETTAQAGNGSATAEDRLEAAVAARRADAVRLAGRTAGEPAAAATAPRQPDPVEDMIATRKRARPESAAGFCPNCGRPVQKSDKFCSKCGRTL